MLGGKGAATAVDNTRGTHGAHFTGGGSCGGGDGDRHQALVLCKPCTVCFLLHGQLSRPIACSSQLQRPRRRIGQPSPVRLGRRRAGGDARERRRTVGTATWRRGYLFSLCSCPTDGCLLATQNGGGRAAPAAPQAPETGTDALPLGPSMCPSSSCSSGPGARPRRPRRRCRHRQAPRPHGPGRVPPPQPRRPATSCSRTSRRACR